MRVPGAQATCQQRSESTGRLATSFSERGETERAPINTWETRLRKGSAGGEAGFGVGVR
eukprot:CAMPEP_0168463918 /NCGR_PEP_ID=MMETSP0228-20121227/55309_1 /TAXON_ID=133427 /ORGANISM="Protoceratium reticulatum, Strain CCCM 535 (=CCMP 1889)" /LENGTH=58 /DNA_ID=CAMNT_0008479401 /DNA_START=154 /DNA_END=326 /DNA_ORIENTATION=-